jgi:predicted transcriptional regulator
MKKLIFTLLFTSLAVISNFGQTGIKLAVGMKAPEWSFTDADGKAFSMDTWTGKVLQVNYVDPDEQDMNEAFNDLVKKAKDVDKRINGDFFKGIGIVDCKSTWKPDFLIRSIAGKKAKKFNTTILFDYSATLQNLWGFPKDSYTIAILDKNRICRALFKGKMAETEYEKTIQFIIQLTKE